MNGSSDDSGAGLRPASVAEMVVLMSCTLLMKNAARVLQNAAFSSGLPETMHAEITTVSVKIAQTRKTRQG